MPSQATLAELFDQVLRGADPRTPPPFDLPTLDAAVGEVHLGDLVLIGGHPGAPVEALVLCAALAAARRGERTVIVAPGPRGCAVAAWLLSTTGLPLDVIWERRVPEVVAETIAASFTNLPLTIVDGLGEGVAGVAAATEAGGTERPTCLAVLGARWLDAHRDLRLLLFDLKRHARLSGLRAFVGIDTRFPGPQASLAPPRPDTFPDPAIVSLADVTLLLSAPWIYAEGLHREDFWAAIVSPAARRTVVGDLRNPRRTMQIISPDET